MITVCLACLACSFMGGLGIGTGHNNQAKDACGYLSKANQYNRTLAGPDGHRAVSLRGSTVQIRRLSYFGSTYGANVRFRLPTSGRQEEELHQSYILLESHIVSSSTKVSQSSRMRGAGYRQCRSRARGLAQVVSRSGNFEGGGSLREYAVRRLRASCRARAQKRLRLAPVS